MKKPLIVIAGPTASGKTAVSVLLAQRIDGEIISADSMQVYRHMDIGTAKIKKEEMGGIAHYLIDEWDPDEPFHVMAFQKKAKEYLRQIVGRGKYPILVGGTGFYINALVYDTAFSEGEEDRTVRDKLERDAKEKGAIYLHEKLKEVDPISYDAIHAHNVKRVIRALEYYQLTGKPISAHNQEEKKKESPYHTAFILLTMDRAMLYDRINQRVDQMIASGLVEEVEKLLQMGYTPDLVSMQGLGYKELVPYVNHKISLDQAVERIKTSTRHFAKRQLTWFKGQTEGHWIDVGNLTTEQTVDQIIQYLKSQDFEIKEL